MKKRNLSLGKYGISGKRYKELCGFCEQYPEWKKKLKDYSFLPSMNKEAGMPDSPNHGTSDLTGRSAMDRIILEEKCELVERVAKMASEEFSEYILKSVCGEVSVTYLIDFDEMPISRASFCDLRRYFFFLLDKEKK